MDILKKIKLNLGLTYSDVDTDEILRDLILVAKENLKPYVMDKNITEENKTYEQALILTVVHYFDNNAQYTTANLIEVPNSVYTLLFNLNLNYANSI